MDFLKTYCYHHKIPDRNNAHESCLPLSEYLIQVQAHSFQRYGTKEGLKQCRQRENDDMINTES